MELNNKDIKRIIGVMMAESGIESKAELAKRLGIKDVTFRAALNNGSLRFADFMRICELLSYKIEINKEDIHP